MAIKVECEHCYTQLNLKDASKVGKKIRCPKCKQPFTITPMESNEFADDFGDLGDDEFATPPMPKKSAAGKKRKGKGKSKGKGKKKKQESGGMMLPLIIGGGVLALLLIGGGIFFFMSGGDDPVVADKPAAKATEDANETGETGSEETTETKQASVEKEEPQTEVVEAASALPPNTLNTEFLPGDSQFVMHLKPSKLLEAAILKDVLEMEFAKQGLASFQEQYGFPLTQVEEITLGVAPDIEELMKFAPTGAPPMLSETSPNSEMSQPEMEEYNYEDESMYGENGMSGMPSVPPAPKMSAVFRVAADIDVSKVKFLREDSGDQEYEDDYMEESSESVSSGSSESSGKSEAKSKLYKVVMPASPGGPKLKVSFPNKRTMVFAEKQFMDEVLAATGSKVCTKYPFVSKSESFILSGSLDFIPTVRKQIKDSGQPVDPELEKVFALYDQGAEAGFLAFDLNDALTIRSGLATKDDAAAAGVQKEFASLEQQMRSGYEENANQLPQGFEAPLNETMDSLKVVSAENTVHIEAKLTMALFQEVKTQLEGVGGQFAMSMAQNMMASQLGPGFTPGGPGGGMFPGGPGGMPIDNTPEIQSEPTPAKTASGLPEGYEMAAVADAGPTPEAGTVFKMIVDGTGEQIVQYSDINLTATAWTSGSPVKRSRSAPQAYSTNSTWQPTETYKIGAFGKTVQVIPVPIYPHNADEMIQQFTGNVMVQTASDVQTIEVDLSNEMSRTAPEVEAAGIRIATSGKDRDAAFFIMPAEEGTVVVSVKMTDGSGMPRGGQFPSGYSGTSEEMEYPSGSNGDSSMDSEMYNEEYGGANAKVAVKPMAPSLGISRPAYADPQGYVVAFDKEKSRAVSITVARGLNEQMVSFECADVPVASAMIIIDPEAEPVPATEPQQWTQVADSTVLPEGIDRIEATGTWRPYQEDNKRQTLDITLDLVGPAAERIMSVLRHSVDDCIAADDKVVVFADNDELLNEPDRMMRLEQKATAPFGTYRITLPFNAVSPSFEELKVLEGEVRIQVAEQVTTFIIADLDDYEGKRILHPILSKQKILLGLEVDEETKQLVLTLDPRSGTKVASLTLVDDEGNVRPEIPQSITEGDKGAEEFRFDLGEESLKSFGLQAVVYINGETVRVPFKFEAMPLPPPPVEE